MKTVPLSGTVFLFDKKTTLRKFSVGSYSEAAADRAALCHRRENGIWLLENESAFRHQVSDQCLLAGRLEEKS